MSAEPTFERLVFCDVDDTVIRCTSAADFLRYYLEARHGHDGALRAEKFLADLYGRIARGLPREEANRAYHRVWRGHQLAELEVWARKWYAERSVAADFYVAGTSAELRRHRAEGAAVALVSGSFPPLLGPVAEAVGARFVLCARLERCGRVLTGRLVGPPVIGEGKLTLVRELLAQHPHIDPADCYAYGDHPSDRPMLQSVGHPFMVAPDGTLSPAVC